MPRFSPLVSLERSLTKLIAERQTHIDALARIDALFGKFEIATIAPAPVAVAAPAKPAKVVKLGRPRKRQQFAQTAEEFVLSLLAGKSLVTSEINHAWILSGRRGNADNTLYILTKRNVLKRVPAKDGPGSSYSVA